jgi:hypothetical protein
MKPLENWNSKDFDEFFKRANIDSIIKIAQSDNGQSVLAGLMSHYINAQQNLELIIKKHTSRGIPRYVVLSNPAYKEDFKDSGRIEALKNWIISEVKPLVGKSAKIDAIINDIKKRYSTQEGSSVFPEVFGEPIGKGMPINEKNPVIATKEEKIMKENKTSDKYKHIANMINSPNVERKKVISSGIVMKESVSDSLFETLSKQKFDSTPSAESCADYGFVKK